jgi:hypothetical protein
MNNKLLLGANSRKFINIIINYFNYRLSIKIFFTITFLCAIYGLVSAGKIVIKKINADNYTVENININWVQNQYVYSGTARDTVTGSIVEFNYASSDIVKADPQLLKAILNKLATNTVKEHK